MVGENLRKIMSEKKITAKELAVEAQISATHLSYVLNGKRNLSLDLAEKLADILHVPLMTILQDSDFETPIGQAEDNNNMELAMVFRAAKELTEEELKAVRKYMQFTMSQRKKEDVHN